MNRVGVSIRGIALLLFGLWPAVISWGSETLSELPIPPLLESRMDDDGVRIFSLVADEGETEFFPGVTTSTLGYNGGYLGPTIRVRRNDRVSINVRNRLEEPTTVHWHGADVPAESDGGPHQGIPPHGSWTADFTVKQQAATLWYHPHFIGTTARQVYEGLAGLLIIDDDVSEGLGIPGDYGLDDIPVILQERRFDGTGRFEYRPGMPDIMHGYFGNRLLVNGAVGPYLEVPKGIVRLRLLNGSNSTLLRLRFEGMESVHQIASDGGFLAEPVRRDAVLISPGERVEILADFGRIDTDVVRLIADTNGGNSYAAMEFRTGDQPPKFLEIPETLAAVDRIPEDDARRTRRFDLQTAMGGRMLINGRMMDMDRIDEEVRLGDTEIWHIINRDGMGGGMMGGMMNQPHNFHVHAVQFQILDYNGEPPPDHLAGWKDTVLLWPGDQVRIIARFESYPGVYMYHCHLLEHEDRGMMGSFEILKRD